MRMPFKCYALSTSDNPYNPWTQFDEWYAFDTAMGYHSCSYLARLCMVGDDESELDEILEIQEVIDEIVTLNLTGNYIKVEEPEHMRDL